MDFQHMEIARQAVALLRDALAGEREDRPRLSSLIMDSNSAKYRAAHGLAVHLLSRCVDPADLENELARIDTFLAERMADTLLDGVDFDHLDWTV